MASQITPAPKPLRPRQTYDPSDPYGLSSLYAELSSLYSEYPELSAYESYSYDADYYSSLLADFYSLYPSYSIPGFTATSARAQATDGTGPTATAVGSTSNESNNGAGGGGLSTGAKIGIGVGVPLGVFLLIGIGIFLWCAGKRKGKKASTAIIAPSQPSAPPQMGYANTQGYIQGYQQPPQGQIPPPQYQSLPPQQVQPANQYADYGAYGKEPNPGVVELEQEYHFAGPGVVEMGDGIPVSQGRK